MSTREELEELEKKTEDAKVAYDNAMDADGEGAWKEVMKTNFAKIDHETGKVRKREDGKVLKPINWQAPQLASFLK